MKTVDKALSVLDQFTVERREIGLSELARLAGLDKAATRRLLVALSEHGFIEQVEETRKYRLGHGFLRLAQIREATVPIEQAAREVADWLLAQTGETVHLSVPQAASMASLTIRLPPRSNVINILPGEVLHYHATAAGHAFMAFATAPTLERILSLKREKVASGTTVTRAEVMAQIEETRAQGYARTRSSLEDGVASVAMPFFNGPGDPAGSVSIALPQAHMTDARRAELVPILRQGVARLETAVQGAPKG